MKKSKQKLIYIICFAIQVPSILIIGILPIKMFQYDLNYSFYCDIYYGLNKDTISEQKKDNFIREFQKIFPREIKCSDSSSLAPIGIIFFIFFAIIQFICAIIYSITFVAKIKNKLKYEYCLIIFFIVFICFLLIISYYDIRAIPEKTSFYTPDENIYIFDDDKLHEEIRENLSKVLKTKIFTIVILILNIIVIVTTIINIVILFKSKNDDNLRASQLMNGENNEQNHFYPISNYQ